MAKKETLQRKKAVDFTLLISTLSLVFIGIIMVFSASWPEAMQDFGNGYYFLKKQLISASVGLVGLLICMNINYKIWKKYALWIFILALILCAMIFTPLGSEIKGARRWINLGFTTFMPADAMKVGAIIFLSKFLANKKDQLLSLTVPKEPKASQLNKVPVKVSKVAMVSGQWTFGISMNFKR